jgi:hypothetical protein
MNDNVTICLNLQTELFGNANLEAADEYIASDFLDHEAPPGDVRGPELAKSTVRWLHSGLDDITYEAVDAFGVDDRVVLRSLMSGTHAREIFGLPPTNRRFTVQQIHIFRLADGKVAEHWANRDDLGMMRQLGAVGS